jgi:hypothetical protein
MFNEARVPVFRILLPDLPHLDSHAYLTAGIATCPDGCAASFRPHHNELRARGAVELMTIEMELEPGDFHIAVKRGDRTDAPWRWEIWAAGKTRPVAQSERRFETMSEATKQGKAALKALLQKRFPNAA